MRSRAHPDAPPTKGITMRRQCSRLALLTVGAAAVLPLTVLPAEAAATVGPALASDLAGPLQLAIGSDGSLYVGQDFSGTLTRVKNGTSTTVFQAPNGSEVAGVDARGPGTLVYTTSAGAGEESPATSSALVSVLPNGRTKQLADLYQWEHVHNPDHVNTYGFSGLSPECKASWTSEIPDDPYDGQIDTHPYAVAIVPGGWVVADAAGNDLLKVTPDGKVSTLAVLPGQPVPIRAQDTEAYGLPACAAGSTYTAEPVPTDVEVGPDGMLYVSTLAGDPAPGSVYRVDPSTGAATRIATGFVGATNLAVAPDGTVYVAELFADRISKVVAGGPVPIAELPSPAAVEWNDGKLYASQYAFGGPHGGQVVTVTP